MQNLLASRVVDQDFPQARLEKIWYVSADASYQIRRQSAPGSGRLILLRTLSGSGFLRCGGKERVLEADSLLIIPDEHIQSYGAQAQGWQFYWFECTAGQMQKESLTIIPFSNQEQMQLEYCFDALRSGGERQCALAEALFRCLWAQWNLQDAQADHRERLLSLLEKGRRQQQSIPQIARQAGMSERSFRDAIHAQTGLSPSDYLLRGEMAAAMELLRTTNLNISQIADSLGYTSPLYFSRVFKNYYGFSPRNIRKIL